MRRRIRWLVVVFALALPGAAAGDAQGAGAAEPAPAGDDRASAGAARDEAAEPPRRGGLVGAVLEWFRGGEEEDEVPRAPGSVLAAVPESESVLPLDPESEPESEPEPAAATEPESRPARARRPAPDAGTVTLAEAYRAAGDLVAEIELLRRAQGIADAPAPVASAAAPPASAATPPASAAAPPAPAESGDGREAPIHAWLESLEVMDKAARVQRRFGMIAFEPGAMPAGDVTLGDTHRNVLTVIGELRRVKRQLVIETRIEPAPPGTDSAPADLHARLAHASALLDGLVGRPVSSNDVYLHVRRVRAALAPLAARLGVSLEPDPPPGSGAAQEPRASKEVAQQILIATYKVVNLQSRLGMAPSDVPGAPAGDRRARRRLRGRQPVAGGACAHRGASRRRDAHPRARGDPPHAERRRARAGAAPHCGSGPREPRGRGRGLNAPAQARRPWSQDTTPSRPGRPRTRRCACVRPGPVLRRA